MSHIKGIKTEDGISLIDYEGLANKPNINGVELSKDTTDEDLNINYEVLKNKPKINGIELQGEISGDDLHINTSFETSSTGNPCIATDSAEGDISEIVIYGQSSQNGTPTPDSPVDIIDKEIRIITVSGRNLFDQNRIETTWTGTFGIIKQDDGSFYVKSTSTDISIGTNKTLKELAPYLQLNEKYVLNAETTGSKLFYLTEVKELWNFGTEKAITGKC